MMDHLFVKIEKLRRLYSSSMHKVVVHRTDDGSFGLGLSEDNSVVKFHCSTNATLLEVGDQIRAVSMVDGTHVTPLGRERLAVVINQQFSSEMQICLQVSRRRRESDSPFDRDLFAILRADNQRGHMVHEWSSDLWTATDAVWGACWTVALPPETHSLALDVHKSHFFSEPLLGSTPLPSLADLRAGGITTRWYGLTPAGVPGELAGEVLLTLSLSQMLLSVSPKLDARYESDSDSEDGPRGPILHATEPIDAIEDGPFPGSVG